MSVDGVVLYPFIERFKEIDYEVLYKMWKHRFKTMQTFVLTADAESKTTHPPDRLFN